MYLEHQQKDMSDTKLIYIWIKSGELMCQICVCYSNIYSMKVKQLEADYRLFNIYIGYWNFENNRSINRLFSESAQH